MPIIPKSSSDFSILDQYGVKLHVRATKGNSALHSKFNRIKKRDKVGDSSPLEAQNAALAEAMAGTVLVGWSNYVTPYSEQAAFAELMDADLREAVFAHASDLANYLAEDYEEEIKKRLAM